MPRPPNILAITTRDSIANLWLMAEKAEEVSILLPSKEACLAFRNKLYAHRSRLRKQLHEVTGTAASHLDKFTFTFHPEPKSLGKWRFTITTEDIVEFELIIPEGYEEHFGPIPHFDTAVNEHQRWDDDLHEWVAPPALDTDNDCMPD